MKNQLQSILKPVLKGSLILICYVFLAACMQHDESLAPNGEQGLLRLDELRQEGLGSMMKNTFTAHLNSENEIPPPGITITSLGQGQAIFKLSEDGTSLSYKLIVANIENVTQAHIHCGDATVNGSVLVFLFGFAPGGVDVNGVLAEGVITQANIRPTHPSCPNIDTFAELLELLRNGTAYVNVHTVAYPGGEIRGQIQ